MAIVCYIGLLSLLCLLYYLVKLVQLLFSDCDLQLRSCRLKKEYFKDKVVWLVGASGGSKYNYFVFRQCTLCTAVFSWAYSLPHHKSPLLPPPPFQFYFSPLPLSLRAPHLLPPPPLLYYSFSPRVQLVNSSPFSCLLLGPDSSCPAYQPRKQPWWS